MSSLEVNRSQEQDSDYKFVAHNEETKDTKVWSCFVCSAECRLMFLFANVFQVISARNLILKQLKIGDLAMVRDVKNGDYDFWCKAIVVQTFNDVLEMGYRLEGVYHTVLSSRIGGIIRPLDDDVATVLSFGAGSVSFLKELRM